MQVSPRRILTALVAAVSLVAAVAAPGGAAFSVLPAAADTAPVRIVLGWAGDPSTSQAVTWRTADIVAAPQAEIGRAASGCSGVAGPARTVAAEARAVKVSDKRSVTHYRAEFTGLTPATRYAYRVGGGSSFSHWHCFSTASAGPAPFRFIYLGDAQRGFEKRWPALVQAALAAAPDARFVVHAGDVVDAGHDDRQWGEWVAGMGPQAAEVPGLPVPGDNDLIRAGPDRVFAAPALWSAHFAVPANGPADLPELAGQNYVVDYQGLRVVAVDVNAFANDDFRKAQRAPVQAALVRWLRRVFTTNPQRWTVVVQHQPVYSVVKSRDYPGLRKALGALYDEFRVDLVLQGHDHAYGRTHKVHGGRVADARGSGTVYATSVSGTQMESIASRWRSLMARLLAGEQLFQVVSVTTDRLSYESRSANGTLVDAFDLVRSASPTSSYVDRAPGVARSGRSRSPQPSEAARRR
jgi:Purple acid Phosphatase, N-terminal domain/Calcineurin-like phosphoesterase